MGGAFCRLCCNRPSESGDALDELGKPWPEKQTEDFVGLEASCRDRSYVNRMMWLTFAGFPKINAWERQVAWEAVPSPIVNGLSLLEQSQSNTPESLKVLAEALKTQKTVIVGSVRMGYGHHRIAYSALTWALELGGKPFLLDILSPDCIEAAVVRNMDKQYSRMSRIASNLGGVFDAIWGKMMLQGDANALRLSLALAQRIRGIMAAFPKDVPVITTHPFVGNMAVACGFKHVINLIFDNLPQYFVLVPGALNLVQSPSYFDKLLDMGCPAKSLRLAGHWVSSDLCINAVADSKSRIERSEQNLPRRFLIAVGGAGAQSAFLSGLLSAMAPLLRDKKIRIYLNCGDHKHIADAIVSKLKTLDLDWNEVTSSEGTVSLCKKEALDLLEEPPNWKAVTVFRFDSHFAAFRCTDLVIRVADVLVTKPSELAFFPVPKLHIRRVGAHEAHSAVRAQELGDGSVECREVPHAMQKLGQLIEPQSPLFRLMNECIIKAAEQKVYEGSKVACEFAFGAQ
ncbi:CIPK28 [Symbiodinium sp. CCMP2456]|nr:CIPK28 [Symbiodinium sp. CCMP2456]